MADIQVTLGLDDKDYTSKLAAATKSADAFGAKAKAAMGEASKGTDGLTTAAESLNKKLESMTSLIVGVGFAEFVKGAFEAGSATAELAKAMGVATSTLYEMQLAAVPAGISTEKLGAMMSKMEINAQAAVEGNLKLRDSFKQLGVSTDYMRTHSADEVFNQIAKSLAGITNPAQRAALAMEVLGKGAKFADWKEYEENLRKTVGTQTEAGDVMDKSKEIMDKLAVKAMLIRSEFIKLIEPLISLVGEKGFGGAKLAAEALLVVLGGFALTAAINGVRAFGTAISGIAGMLGLTSATAVAATGATTALTGAEMNWLRVEAAANSARSASLVATIAETRAKMASILATNGEAIATLELVGLKRALMLASGQAGLATAAAAGSQAALAEASLVANAAVVTQVGLFARLGAMFASIGAAFASFMLVVEGVAFVLSAPLWIAFAGVIAVIAAAIAGAIVLWKAFGDVIKEYVGKAFDWVAEKAKDVFNWVNDGLDKMANGLRKLVGLAPIGKEGAQNARDNRNPTDERLAGGTQGSPALTAAKDLNPQLAIVQGLQNQADAMALVNRRTLERLTLEIQLATASDAVRKSKLADFDTTTATMKEEQRITGEIKRLTLEDQNTKGAGHADEIKFLNQQLGVYKQQAASVAERTKTLVEAQNKEAMALFFSEEKLKVLKNVQDLTESIAQLTMSADDKKLADIQKQINAEMELAVKKREAQLGGPVGKEGRDDIMASILANYQPLINKQKELNVETNKYNDLMFGLDLSNKMIDDKIRLTSQLDQMTMTNNEKIIRQLQEQIDLAIRAEIVKRESALAPGQHLDAGEVAKVTQQITDSYKVQVDGAQQSIDKSREWSTGWSSAFKQYIEDGTNMATQAKTTFDSMTSNMNSAIDTFVNTGKFSFEDFASSIIKDLVKIEMKALAMEGLKGLFGEKGGGGGLLSTIGSFIGGLFADGGDPPVGKASIVGERGPELFVPKTAGTIVPNNALGGGGGQQITNNNTTVNHYTVNAVDAKSVAQLFAENRKQLLGTVRMAQAEQPYASRL